MLPGTLCDERLFSRQARALEPATRVWRTDYRDLRGPSWCDVLLARLPPRFALAGFSLGGLWALELLRRAPERVKGLALVASNAEPGRRTVRRRSARLWRDWRRLGPESVVEAMQAQYFHHDRQRRRHAALLRDMARRTPTPAARAQFDWASCRPCGLQVLAASHVPLLVVSGARDRLCPRALQRRVVQARPDARWIELPRCGHFVPLEAHSALSRALQQWLHDTAPARTGAPS